jgi:hypothetical protein
MGFITVLNRALEMLNNIPPTVGKQTRSKRSKEVDDDRYEHVIFGARISSDERRLPQLSSHCFYHAVAY